MKHYAKRLLLACIKNKTAQSITLVYALSFVIFACSSTGGHGYYSTVDKYRPESWRPSFFSPKKRPPTRTENWKNYKVGKPYKVMGKWYTPKENPNYSEVGLASWYGPKFHNKLTANGEIFDRYAVSAAHKTLPMPSILKVTNLKNGKSIKLRLNDRGPFKDNRIIDLSEKAAEILGFKEQGVTKVRVEFDAKETAKLFHDSWDPDEKAKPKTRVARHKTSPEYTTVEARLHEYDTHYVQTGAYSSSDSAHSVARDLHKVGKVNIEEAELRGEVLYRVKIGPYRTQDEAGEILEKVAYLGFDDAIIIGR